MEILSKDYMKGYFSRNRKLILIALAILLIFFFIGVIVGNISAGDSHGSITKAMSQSNKTLSLSQVKGDAIGLFLHNLFADFIIFICGILFSVFSVLIVIYNALTIGIPFGADLYFALVSIVPHFIFEYLGGSVFALTGAFLITKLEINIIKKRSIKEVISDSYILKDILFSFLLMVIFLFIAAIIEAYVTPAITIIAFP